MRTTSTHAHNWRSSPRIAALALAFMLTPISMAQDGERAQVASPDGRIIAEIFTDGGAPAYRVLFDGEELVADSRLGLRFAAGADLDSGLALVETAETATDESWEQPWGERRVVRDHHNELLARFRNANGDDRGVDVRFRVFDDGVAFRYEVTAPDGADREIVDEITEFSLDPDAEAWWIPSGLPNRYEILYRSTPLRDVDRAAHTPITLKTSSGVYVSIHEAALVDYAGMWFAPKTAPGHFEAELAPWHDGVKVRVSGSFVTPWRTIQIADEAVGLINSDLILNLNEPNVLGDVSWVEPGVYVGIWWGMHINAYTWGSGERHGATTERTRRHIDFAADNGFVGVLVEGWNEGWDGDWYANGDIFSFTQPYPDFDIEGLAAYAAERGVRLIGHHETSGSLANYESQMEDAFDLYERLGIRAVKTGYVADSGELTRQDEDGHVRHEWHDGQYSVNHHIRVLEMAAARQIAINPHEPVKDTGLRRTYPNWLTREGARGQEYNAWGVPPNPPEHVPLLAFTRMLSGPMDFTPGIFDLDFGGGLDATSRVQTTLAKQLALYVVLYSPIQMAADLPENYEARPDLFQFIRDVPADWEESVALQGEPGDFVVVARQERGGTDWFLGAATDEEARAISVPLSFLEAEAAYTAHIYRDGDDADWASNPYSYVIEERSVSADDSLDLALAPGGGAAIRFIRAE